MSEGNELRELSQKILRKKKVQSMLQSLLAEGDELRSQARRLKEILAKEQADVDRLEGRSLAAAFYALMSRKDEKLDREKAEAYAAAVKYETAVRQLQAVEREIESLRAELEALGGAEKDYDRAFERESVRIKETDQVLGEKIRAIEVRLGYLSAQIREVDEAISVGNTALGQISSIEASLNSAEGWGTWDMLGGGLISNMAKHARLDEAQYQVNALQETLRRYRTELADVTLFADIQVQVEGFLRFADYFFDGLFVDWTVLNRIHSAQEQISSTRSEIEGIQYRLGEMRRNFASEEDQLKKELDDIVLKAQNGLNITRTRCGCIGFWCAVHYKGTYRLSCGAALSYHDSSAKPHEYEHGIKNGE